MNIVQATILGIVEGVTEFLPVSSTGHLILVGQWLQIPQTEIVKSFDLIIQLGAMLAVAVTYWQKLFFSKQMLGRVGVAFLPTAVIGVLVFPWVKLYLLGNGAVVVWALGLGGLALIAFELTIGKQPPRVTQETAISYRQAFIIGLWQSLAIVPGISRAAATIVGGMMQGISRPAIVEFSFLLAIPTLVAATGLDVWQSASLFAAEDIGLLAIGFAASFMAALLAVRWLLHYIQTHTLIAFGLYRMVVALLFWLML